MLKIKYASLKKYFLGVSTKHLLQLLNFNITYVRVQ